VDQLHVVLAAVVESSPSAEGLPGAEFIQTLLDWLTQLALWGSLASVLAGAGWWGFGQMAGNSYQSNQGRGLAVGGGIGAALAALADAIIAALFTAAG